MASLQKIITVSIVLCCVISAVLCEEDEMDFFSDTNVAEGRTFGHHFLKRISFAIIPAAFVVGVITTLLGALTVVSIKGLGVGVILLVLAIGQLLARSLPHAHAIQAAVPAAVPFTAPPIPISSPVWLEKNW